MTVDDKRKEYEAQQKRAMAKSDKPIGQMVKDNSSLKQLLQSKMDSLAQAIPQTAKKYLTPERIVKVVGMACSRNPKLLECTGASILFSVMDSVSLGLEPGGPLEHAYLVPYYNGKTKNMESKCIVSYKGYMDLARRSGEITSISCQLVYEKDLDSFDIDLANHSVKHRPYMGSKDRGDWVAGYCSAKFRNGDTQLEFMTRKAILKIRDQVLEKLKKDWLKKLSPWTQHEEEMARKTVVRRARKYWPLSVESQQVMARAEQMEDISQGFIEPTEARIVDITPTKELDAPTQEPAKLPPAADKPPKQPEVPPAGPKVEEAPQETVDASTGEVINAEFKPSDPWPLDMSCPSLKDLGELSIQNEMTEKEWYEMLKKAGIKPDEKEPDEKYLRKLQELVGRWIADIAASTKPPADPPKEEKKVKVREKATKDAIQYLRQRAKECALEKDEDILLAMKGTSKYVVSEVKKLEDLTGDEVKKFLAHLDGSPRA